MELKPTAQGKVRDIYDLGKALLIVSTDRLSAFDVVLPDPVLYKGEVLTKLSLFWFDLLGDIVPNHLLTAEECDLPEKLAAYADSLRGRFMIVKKAEVFPVECIVRGYLAGSGWKEYREHGTVCGQKLPEGLVESSRLPQPIFTPSTKAAVGDHDENISYERMVEIVGADRAEQLRDASLALYSAARDHAAERGIIIADTKFEFGLVDGEVTLIDEVLTPDSSRFWPADEYAPGGPQPSYDKQFVRDWLEASGWDKTPPAPSLPEDILAVTAEKYIEAYEAVTGQPFMPEGA
ncbi:MAG TPA: phosphoribosylaminoimidazolesuccinocarboxamide synthase [Coriobacteriia bacterium]|nr:MAG: Phosphoribosylaminoimidazole-succinocarboxamide synthase [Actinobacteria bacterium 66_15]HAL29521.1 phosphoribosylaminoimidazolesuccinocarboxamide synthase [Coriobacteriia bacterium]